MFRRTASLTTMPVVIIACVPLILSVAGDALAQAGESARIVVDDFQQDTVGQLPPGWDWQSKDDERHKPYAVAQEDGNRYLGAQDSGESVILGKDIRVDISRFPYLSFKWRVHRLPEGGDERFGETNDSAAAVYVIYKRLWGFLPVTVKYVWSSTLPVGTAFRRSGAGRPWVVVAASGGEGIGQWQQHVFDVRAAYRETFGKKAPNEIIAVGILSDANATGSQAWADYDDIVFLPEAEAGSGIRKIVDAP